MRNRSVPPSSGIQWKTNGLPIFLFFFPFYSLFPPYMVSTPSFQNSKSTHLLSIFCLHTLLPRWNSGMTTKIKIVQVRARWTCFMWEVFVLCTQNVRLTIHHSVLFLSFSFLPLKLGFPIYLKQNTIVFFKLN